MTRSSHPENERLKESALRNEHWRRWGTFLSERQWGTVREDYSSDGSCWSYFSHEDALSRAYRWGEDGLLGWSDRHCRLCFSFAFWNGRDPFLKERLFGLTGPEGNHGEDVKECYYYLDSLPSHAYQKALYKYPQQEFPYQLLRDRAREGGKSRPEFELIDTGIFDGNEYFDLFIEYAKDSPDETLIRLTAVNVGPRRAPLHILPTLWFRNGWSWGRIGEGYFAKPTLQVTSPRTVMASHELLGKYIFSVQECSVTPSPLMTENETNYEKLFGTTSSSPFVKDAFHRHLVFGEPGVINEEGKGTKFSWHYPIELEPQEKFTLHLRLSPETSEQIENFGGSFDALFDNRIKETETFYRDLLPKAADKEISRVERQAYAGLLWSKQFYWYGVEEWTAGDPSQPRPERKSTLIRNQEWAHLYNRDVLSMPDKWEYPWYAAWDTAFHMIPMSRIDPEFAKEQLLLFLREWYMHPNGQIPAYEFAFSDVNPPVHAWACWRVYKMTGAEGERDGEFLARAFQKLLVNFTWWVNRKDVSGRNLFSGGFLGLDNIGVFDRSATPPVGQYLEQADATAWMAFYAGTMLSMAIELASIDRAYEDMASKFFEHFIHIADAMNSLGGTGMWNEEKGFYFDILHMNDAAIHLQVHSLVGLIPLFAVEVFQDEQIKKLPNFLTRARWFLKNRPELRKYVSYLEHSGQRKQGISLLALPSAERLKRILERLLDEDEFLSDHGIRSLSKCHERCPYIITADNKHHSISYEPGESSSSMFGGNSNWRGPVWFPVNFLLIESLERYHYFYGDSFQVECPKGSGKMCNLREVSWELSRRLVRLFLPDKEGARPCHGKDLRYSTDSNWSDLVLFYENFHGETGKGLGASHQTGWTALVAVCLEKLVKKGQL